MRPGWSVALTWVRRVEVLKARGGRGFRRGCSSSPSPRVPARDGSVGFGARRRPADRPPLAPDAVAAPRHPRAPVAVAAPRHHRAPVAVARHPRAPRSRPLTGAADRFCHSRVLHTFPRSFAHVDEQVGGGMTGNVLRLRTALAAPATHGLIPKLTPSPSLYPSPSLRASVRACLVESTEGGGWGRGSHG